MRSSLPILLAFIFGAIVIFPQDEKLRIYVTDSQSWAMAGGFGSSGNSAAGGFQGGSRPQTAEIIKTFNERCKELTVTINKEKANYVVLLDREGGTGVIRKDNKVVVFSGDGDAIFSGSTTTLGNAVKDACDAIRKAEKERSR